MSESNESRKSVRLLHAGGDGPVPEGVALIQLDRPPLNLIDRGMLAELAAVVESLAAAEDVRAVVLAGAGGRFSAGIEVAELSELDTLEATALALRGQEVLAGLSSLSQPVVGAVDGACHGGGLELALACDLRLAADDATFGLPQVKLGVVPGWGATQRLPRLIGEGRARSLILTGRQLDAAAAHAAGLVDEVVAPDKLLPAALALAGRLATGPSLAIAAAKEAIAGGCERPLAAGLRLEAAIYGGLYGSEDQKEGMQAHLQNREPTFRGR